MTRYTLPLAATFLALATFATPSRAQTRDVNLDLANKLISTMYADSRDAGRVVSTLRATRDPALVPLFDKLATSKDVDIQVAAQIAAAIISKDPAKLDLDKFLSQSEPRTINAGLAILIDSSVITNDQLQTILKKSKDQVARVMVASELLQRKALSDHTVLKDMLTDAKDEVRIYAAVSLMTNKDDAENAEALKSLNLLTDRHDPKTTPIQALMTVRIRKENITLALPWVAKVAADEKCYDGLRRTALSVLLALNDPHGPQTYADLALREQDTIQQIELALIAVEWGSQLKADNLVPLEGTKSSLCRTILVLAKSSVAGEDYTADLVKLLKEGHPIVLNWALVASEHAPAARKLAIRNTIIEQSTIVDDQRRSDFERAAVAAQKLADDKTPESRAALAKHLKSDEPAIVEAVLAGLARSDQRDLAELVLPFWDRFAKKQTVALYNSANYAAIILAREDRKEPKDWLAGMIEGGTLSTAQDSGFRVLAGWYYAKLIGQSDTLIKQILTQPAPTQPATK